MKPVEPGHLIEVLDAGGEKLSRRAVSGVVRGQGFNVVWACRLEEWDLARREGRDPITTPWPAEDVVVVESVGAS